MAAKETKNLSARPPRWPLSEKRRIVELTHVKGASISEIAEAHGIHPTILSRWRSWYRAGKLSDDAPRERSSGAAATTTLLPVMISTRHSEDAAIAPPAMDFRASSRAPENAVVHVSLSSGVTVRRFPSRECHFEPSKASSSR